MEKVITRTSVLLILAGIMAVSGTLFIAGRYTASSVPAFVYEEIAVTRPAVQAATLPMAVEAPVAPLQATPLPITAPKVIFSVMPEYPVPALQKGIEGVAIIEAGIGLDGSLNGARVKSSSGNEGLDLSALNAVRQWKFSPATQGNLAVSSIYEFPVRFTINNGN